MANAKKLPSGSWRVQAAATVNGRKIIKSFTDPDRRTAERMALEWQTQKKDVSHNSRITLGQAAKEYISRRSYSVSPVTVETYKGYCERYLADLQEKEINKIGKNDLQIAFNELAARLSPKTVSSIHGFFSSVIFEFTGERFKINLPKIPKRIYNTPDAEAGKKILEAVSGTKIELPINLALRCGLRISEVCGLKWENVHDNYISIENVIVYFGTTTTKKGPKSNAGTRNIPIAPDIKALIDKQPHINDYVIQKSAGAIRAAFKRLLDRKNIPHRRLHDLRHGFASSMAAMGVPERYAMAIGGWDTPKVLHEVYEQTFTDLQFEYAKKTDEYFKK